MDGNTKMVSMDPEDVTTNDWWPIFNGGTTEMEEVESDKLADVPFVPEGAGVSKVK